MKNDKKHKKEAKMEALKEMLNSMSDSGGMPMKKVTVMAKNKSGLKEGLEKAKEMIGNAKMDSGDYKEHDKHMDKAHDDYMSRDKSKSHNSHYSHNSNDSYKKSKKKKQMSKFKKMMSGNKDY